MKTPECEADLARRSGCLIARALAGFLALALVVVGYPFVRSPIIRQDLINDYAARRAKYLDTPLALIGDSQVSMNPSWGWDLEHDPLAVPAYATPGGTLFQISQASDRVVAAKPRIVVVIGGSNDAFLGVPVEQSVANYLTLVQTLRKSGAQVVAALAPPSRQRVQSTRLRTLNDVLRVRLRTERVQLIELPELVDKDGLLAERYVRPDGIHLNSEGYRVFENKLSALQ